MTARKRLQWGVDYAGRPVHVTLGAGHILVGGTTDAGKSGVINSIVASAAEDPTIGIVGLDLKRVELSPWADRCAWVARTRKEVDDTLDAVVTLMRLRYEWMDRTGVRTWPGHHVLVVADELAEVFRVDVLAAGNTQQAKTDAALTKAKLESLAAMARAAGMTIVSATQRPAAETIGDEYRSNHTQRICLRVANEHVATMVLGEVPEGVEPWLIPSDKPGTADFLTPSGVVRCRATYYDDDAVAAVVRRTAHHRLTAGTLPALIDEVAA